MNRLRRLRLGLAAAATAAAIAAAGCGGDESSPSVGASGGGGGGDSSNVRQSGPTIDGFNPQKIYSEAAPGVVTIQVIFGGGGVLGGGGAQGSGFVLNDRGEIATNAHVVTQGGQGNGSGALKPAEEVYVDFPDRNKVPAEIIGFDPFADVALIKVDPDGLDLTPVSLGDDKDIVVGEPVAAIGSPFGADQSLSIGVVSATDRSIESLTDFSIDGAIQTDASINPGNSGGPLMDGDGRVIGINQQINTTSGGNEGVGFAVPIDLAKRSIDQIRDNGEVRYAFIGITSQALYPQLADKLDIDADTGALIAEVTSDGPADEAGLRGGDSTIEFQAQEITVGGDVITAIDGEKLTTPTDLARLIALRDPGDKVEVEIIRDGDEETIEVTLGERDPDPDPSGG